MKKTRKAAVAATMMTALLVMTLLVPAVPGDGYCADEVSAASPVLLLASAASRSIWPAGAALLFAVVAILMVIKWI